MKTVPKYTITSQLIQAGIFAKTSARDKAIALSYAHAGHTPSLIQIQGLGKNPIIEQAPITMRIEFPDAYLWFNTRNLASGYDKTEDLYGSLIIDGDQPSVALHFNNQLHHVTVGTGRIQPLEGFFFWTNDWKLLSPGEGGRVATIFDNLETDQ